MLFLSERGGGVQVHPLPTGLVSSWEGNRVKTKRQQIPEQQESRVQTRRDSDCTKRQQETSEWWESRAQTTRERAGLFLRKKSCQDLEAARYQNNERVEFKPGEIEIASRGNKRPSNNERVELKQSENELVSSCLLTWSHSCLVWSCEEATRPVNRGMLDCRAGK